MGIRGSDNPQNWIRDFQVARKKPTIFEDCSGCLVENGFYTIWKNIQQETMQALAAVGCDANSSDNQLVVTGHSLGAAITHLAMFTLQNRGYEVLESYSFEAPRVGNKHFSDAFDERFTRKYSVFRVTHWKDPVPHLPPELLGYYHVPTEIYVNKTGGIHVCNGAEDRYCADRWPLVETLFHAKDHCGFPLVKGGDICSCATEGPDDSTTVLV